MHAPLSYLLTKLKSARLILETCYLWILDSFKDWINEVVITFYQFLPLCSFRCLTRYSSLRSHQISFWCSALLKAHVYFANQIIVGKFPSCSWEQQFLKDFPFEKASSKPFLFDFCLFPRNVHAGAKLLYPDASDWKDILIICPWYIIKLVWKPIYWTCKYSEERVVF